MQLLLVFVGSGLGGVLRHLFGSFAASRFGPSFPLGTIAINVVGSFLIVAVLEAASAKVIGPELRLALTTGLLGGFTTYSTFNQETIALFQRGAPGLAALNVAVTVVLCLLAGGAALWLSRALLPA